MTEKSSKEKQKRLRIKRKRGACQPVAASGIKRHNKNQPVTFSEKELREELLREAKALRMPAGAAEVITSKVAEQVSKWVAKRPVVTVDDIYRRIAVEAEKYSADLAYVYQNRGKII